ncbi:MAG: ABC transporter permease [Fibrobacter sp.]|nr:ABC transporter permease [Fibrobacter sp.]
MLLALSWKNVWRNRMRSGVVITSVALGLFGGVFSTGFMNGMARQTINDAVSIELSHIQIHEPSFSEEPLPSRIIPDADKIAALLRTTPDVVAVAIRGRVTAMIASAKTGSGVTVKGVIPEDEKTISSLPNHLTSGTWFENGRKNEIVIGHKLAEKLDAKLKSRVVLTTQTMNGTLTGGAFKIAGIFQTHNSTFDENNVFVRHTDLAQLLEIAGNATHEIAILLPRYERSDSVAAQLRQMYPSLRIETWSQIQPETGMMEGLMTQMMYLFVIIIMIALTFGIINTMLMAVLDRQHEFGMLMAVGMSKWRIFSMVMIETVFLAVIGGLAGMAMGGAAITLTGTTGIDLSIISEGLAVLGYNPIVYPFIDTVFFAEVTIAVVVTGIVSSIYPALKALGLNPADAVRSKT